MNYTNNNTESRKLNRPINTILNKIHRGTTTQIKQGRKVEVYLADTGEAIYLKNRQNSHHLYKPLECSTFINYVIDKIINDSWSPDACFGNALKRAEFERSQMVSL